MAKFGTGTMKRSKETEVSREFLEQLLAPYMKSTTGTKYTLDIPDIIKVRFVKKGNENKEAQKS